ncbi:cupin [Pacificimonas flava]|uniref:Cupin n=2 Tax=Pacificimonas TaxID=1960290 RepID=A0A219B501_9SPHN|nr:MULTISPECIES: cupin domain-containing protein [Pacificimonas]MBZ6377082.1 cupin domain-containing protein [Pacificimonas aurantium]OWV33186.1 cupin [Pacificimonas flava]
MSTRQTRRIVTGHDDDGRAVFLEDGPAPRVFRFGDDRETTFTELWTTGQCPAPIEAGCEEPEEGPVTLAPPPGGTRIRIVEFSPEDDTAAPVSPEEAQAQFAAMGAESASRHSGADSRHAFMHRTETIDYGIVLEGEITLILDVGETVVRAGDIVVQRGTNHGWANRSGAPCRVCFVLVDGQFDPALKDL